MWEAAQRNSDTVVTSDSDEETAEPPTKRTKNSPEIVLTPIVPDNNPNEPPGDDVGDKNEGGEMLVTENNPNEPPGDDVAEGMSMLVTNVGDKQPSHGDGHASESMLVTDVGEKIKIAQFQPVQSGTRMEPKLRERFVFSKYREIILIFSVWYKNGQETLPPTDLNPKSNENEGATSVKARSEFNRSDLG